MTAKGEGQTTEPAPLRQTRDDWSPATVLRWSRIGVNPPQTWESVAVEAAHRIVRLETALRAVREQAAETAKTATEGLA